MANMTRLEINKLFAENIEQERYNLGLSQKEMADELDLSLSAYKRIISQSIEKIDLYTCYRLYQMTGKTAYDFMNISEQRLQMNHKMDSLSPSQLSFIDSVVDFEKMFAELHDDAEDYITVFIPTGNMEDGMIYDSSNVKKENIAAYRKKYGSQISCGIKITSNHLHPVYNLGDTILISRRPVRDGDTGVFVNRDNGCVYIRKFHQTNPCMLEPINEYGETFYVNSKDKADMDRWAKFGTVIAKIR